MQARDNEQNSEISPWPGKTMHLDGVVGEGGVRAGRVGVGCEGWRSHAGRGCGSGARGVSAVSDANIHLS